MPNKKSELKKKKIIQRFRSRNTVLASMNQKKTDVYLIDLVLTKLYNDGDKQAGNLMDDVFSPNKVTITESGRDRIWDILLSTGLVKPVIGFGKSGSLNLTNEGYQLMSKFGSYANFIAEREKQAQAASQPGMIIPQFILSGGESEDDGDEGGARKEAAEQKSVGETPDNKPAEDDEKNTKRPAVGFQTHTGDHAESNDRVE